MAERGGEIWNFRVLLGQGVFVDIAQQIASPKLVLPFLYIALGAPVFFAGLLLPTVQVSNLVAQIVAAPSLQSARVRKWYITMASLTVASALAIVCLASGKTSTALIAAVFLFVAIVLGIGQGISNLAFQDLIGWVLPAHRRTTLLFAQTGLAGLLAIGVALFSQYYIDSDGPLEERIELVWGGVGVMLLAALASSMIREPPRSASSDEQAAPVENQAAPAKSSVKRRTAELRESFGAALRLSWMRRFLVARMLFMSIELAMPFYAIHAATIHVHSSSGLRTFVIASSAGLVIGAILWHRISLVSIRGVMILASAAAAIAGVLALAIDVFPSWQTPLVHAGVFVLVAFANQGISNARKVYVVGQASHNDRAYCVAVSNFFGGAAGMVVAFVFGSIAHVQGVTWPIWLMIVLNVAAALYTLRLRVAQAPVHLEPELATHH